MLTTTNVLKKCGYCGQPEHQAICPTVKAIEYHSDRTVKRVEFKTAADYPQIQPLYPTPHYPWPSLPITCGAVSNTN